MVPDRIGARLPWAHPFRMIDRMIECIPHGRITTLKRVTRGDAMHSAGGSEPPILPSAMVLEGMGQSASLLYKLSYGDTAPTRLPLLGYLKASFHAQVHAGDAVTYEVRAVKMTTTMGLFEASAHVGGTQVAEAEFALGVGGSDPEPAGGGS